MDELVMQEIAEQIETESVVDTGSDLFGGGLDGSTFDSGNGELDGGGVSGIEGGLGGNVGGCNDGALQSLTLKYLGEERSVDIDTAVALAQKGMDYDRIRGRYEQLKTTAVSSGGDPMIIKRTEDISDFMDDFPGIAPNSIPREVWSAVKNGQSLSVAYLRWQNAQLRSAGEAMRQNQAAKSRSAGSRGASGKVEEVDVFLRELMK